MNKTFFLTLAASCCAAANSLSLRAQQGPALRLNAMVGPKYNDFTSNFGVGVKPELYTFALGAGSTFLRNRWLAGSEFYFSSGTKTAGPESLQYVGFNTNLFVGYNLLPGSSWRLETTVGFSTSTNQLIAQDEQGPAFLNVVNDQAGVTTAVALLNVNGLGLCTGLKAGYFVPFAGASRWQYRGSGADAGLRDKVDAFFIQLTLGGLINLSKQ